MPKCKGETCGASILFFHTPKGSKVPLNDGPPTTLTSQERQEDGWWLGLWVRVSEDTYRPARSTDPGPFRRGHHVTCPDVENFRKDQEELEL